MLEIKGLKKAFGSLEVLKGVDLKVKQGDVVAIRSTTSAKKISRRSIRKPHLYFRTITCS